MNRLISFGVCSGLILLFGGILYGTVLIIQGEVPAEFISYVPPADDGPPTNTPVVQELTSKSVSASPTVTPSVIVAQNAVGAVASPVSVDTTGDISFDSMDISMGMDVGSGLGVGGSGFGSGTAGGSKLEGTFYDLKMTRSGAPSKIPEQSTKDDKGQPLMRNGKPYTKLSVANGPRGVAYVGAVNKFMSNWTSGALSGYYKSAQPLYASSFYIPTVKSEYAPYAFNCVDVSQRGGWLAVYRGRVRAPKTGKFRFVGVGDGFMAVRINHKLVFEAGYQWPSLWQPDNNKAYGLLFMSPEERVKFWADVKAGKIKGHEGYTNIKGYPKAGKYDKELEGLVAGKVFEVREGSDYSIEILIGDIDGAMCAQLLIEDMDRPVNVAKGDKYDLFRTNFSLPDEDELRGLIVRKADGKNPALDFRDNNVINLLPYNQDSPIWTAVP